MHGVETEAWDCEEGVRNVTDDAPRDGGLKSPALMWASSLSLSRLYVATSNSDDSLSEANADMDGDRRGSIILADSWRKRVKTLGESRLCGRMTT